MHGGGDGGDGTGRKEMRVKEIVKDYNFTLIAESVKPDSHRRLTLPLTECSGTYRIYANTSGQIVLDPVEKKNDN